MIETLFILFSTIAILYTSLIASIGRKRAWCHMRYFLAVVPFGIFQFSALVVYPLAYLIEKVLPKFNPLWWWLDDEIEYAESNADWLIWLSNNGGKMNFWTMYKWHGLRNKTWNLNVLIKPKSGRNNCIKNDETIVEVIKHDLKRDGEDISILSDCLQLAELKWIDKFGNEGFQVFSGVKVSYKFSTFGVSELYYSVGDSLYYRYSYCFPKKIFGKQYFLQIKYGTDHKGYLKTFKIHKV